MAPDQLDNYIAQFSHLRTDVNHNYWTAITQFRAPHKPILLLSILDLFAQGSIPANFIEFTPELGDLFARYWSSLFPPERQGNLALPFFHLRSSPFWHLIPVLDMESALKATNELSSLGQLRRMVAGAQLDDDLYSLLQREGSRNALRTALIETYFAPEVRPALIALGAVNLASYLYSQDLIQQVKHTTQEKSSTEYQEAVRDQGFRKAIVKIYDHRCAFCGVRMLTTDGHSAVDAAHIVPWSVSHNDDPRNGMALCRLCHWTFDEGLATVSAKYTVRLSSELRTSLNVPGHLQTLEGRPILGPIDPAFMPNLTSLGWHRETTFRK